MSQSKPQRLPAVATRLRRPQCSRCSAAPLPGHPEGPTPDPALLVRPAPAGSQEHAQEQGSREPPGSQRRGHQGRRHHGSAPARPQVSEQAPRRAPPLPEASKAWAQIAAEEASRPAPGQHGPCAGAAARAGAIQSPALDARAWNDCGAASRELCAVPAQQPVCLCVIGRVLSAPVCRDWVGSGELGHLWLSPCDEDKHVCTTAGRSNHQTAPPSKPNASTEGARHAFTTNHLRGPVRNHSAHSAAAA